MSLRPEFGVSPVLSNPVMAIKGAPMRLLFVTPVFNPEGHGIEAVIRIGKNLVEVAHADQCLVGQARREGGVVDQRVVLHVNGRDLGVVREMRTNRRRLRALAYEPAKGESIVLVEIVIQLNQAIMAISALRIGVEIVVCCCRSIERVSWARWCPAGMRKRGSPASRNTATPGSLTADNLTMAQWIEPGCR